MAKRRGAARLGETKELLANDLASFAAGIDAARLDDAVVRAVKTNVLDTLSWALAGSSAPAIDEVTRLVREWAGAGQADMLVFGGVYRPIAPPGLG